MPVLRKINNENIEILLAGVYANDRHARLSLPRIIYISAL